MSFSTHFVAFQEALDAFSEAGKQLALAAEKNKPLGKLQERYQVTNVKVLQLYSKVLEKSLESPGCQHLNAGTCWQDGVKSLVCIDCGKVCHAVRVGDEPNPAKGC